ncbi:type II secretion system protein GspM [Massilia cavernae]|uniref:Type II secretion system protein M n=1 Tax=Massilia cavernae TaxID=2320864 RepID=A0A418XQF7_9BURK|nr:type II secretion system protein GspM [Massilia cavernae]RJG14710.1 type II secretion system protein M [Massilia cavernae]
MKAAQSINQLKERIAVWWLARTGQERKYLTVGGAIALAALVYVIGIDPALAGRDALRKQLPELRQQSAELQAMALEASELAGRPVVQPAPMTEASLKTSLAARGITPASIAMTGEYAKLQMNGVSFANLVMWLDAQRRENRIAVQDMVATPQGPAGQVDAALTLHQGSGTAR